MFSRLCLLLAAALVRDPPLSPARSPDGQILGTTEVPQSFVTPEGGNYELLLNGILVYPVKPKHFHFSAYENWHTFLSPLAWSPDSQYVAFAEKIYNWEYTIRTAATSTAEPPISDSFWLSCPAKGRLEVINLKLNPKVTTCAGLDLIKLHLVGKPIIWKPTLLE